MVHYQRRKDEVRRLVPNARYRSSRSFRKFTARAGHSPSEDLLFIGSFAHRPNLDAMIIF
jgi:hypothetical protein